MINLQNPSLFHQQAYINGQWRDAANGDSLEVYNPANNELIGNAPKMGAVETDEAIAAAHAAWSDWKLKAPHERSELMIRWYQLIIANLEDLARLLTIEQGKSLAESRTEILYGASFIQWFAEEAKRIYGDIIASPKASQRILVLKQPIGVVGAITPWNFPNAMITRKCAPALAAGCTIVIKPAELTPFSALALAELAAQAGIPAGVFNIVTGNPEVIGQTLCKNPLVRKLSFTGSTRVGKLLMQQSADNLKKLSLELGGNAPFIVFDDADLDEAIEGAMIAKFRNSGQTCICTNRFLVQSSVYDAFAEKLLKAVKNLKLGDGLAPETQQGPLINQAAITKVETLIKDAVGKDARVLCGGKPSSLGFTFFEPTILSNMQSSMRMAREEIFGPVAALFRFEDEQQAIHMANDTEYGLASYLYSQNINRIWRVSEQLEYGMVAVNTGLFSNEALPFGGIKESGCGREGSKYGIDDYLELKSISLNLKL